LERILILENKIATKLSAKRYTLKAKKINELDGIKNKFIAAMDDDFNAPQALACIFELVNITNKNIDNADFIYNAKNLLQELLDILGMTLARDQKIENFSDDQVKAKIHERDTARENKDYNRADKIRKELEEKGIILEDAKGGKTTWRRKL